MKRPPIGNLLRDYSFLLGVLVILSGAWFYPELGRQGGLLKTEITAKIAVFAIFLFHGLVIDIDGFKKAVSRWQLHLFILLFGFGIIPLIVFALIKAFGSGLSESIKLGFIVMSFMPTTISSSVVLTDRAGGNVPAAILSATLSNLLGVFIVPVGILFYSSQLMQELNWVSTCFRIASLILLPILIGLLLRNLLAKWADRNSTHLRSFSRILVLFIIYAAFCNSITANNWTGIKLPELLTICVFALVAVLLVVIIVLIGTRIMLFNYEDTMAAFFCSSQKTVVVGVPLVKSLIGGTFNVGVVLMPLLFYHALQLLFGVMVSWKKLRGFNKSALK